MSQNTLLCLSFVFSSNTWPILLPPPKLLFLCRRGSDDIMLLEIQKSTQHPMLWMWSRGKKKKRKLNKTHNWAKRANCNRNIFECFMKRYQYPAESSHKAPQQTVTWGVMSRGLIQPHFFSQWAKACRKGEEGRQCAWIYCAALKILPQIFAFRKTRQTQ